MTYKELLGKLNLLTAEQLETKIQVGLESGLVIVDELWVVEEDQINPSGDGVEPVSSYVNDPDILAEEPIVLYKSTPILLGILI